MKELNVDRKQKAPHITVHNSIFLIGPSSYKLPCIPFIFVYALKCEHSWHVSLVLSFIPSVRQQSVLLKFTKPSRLLLAQQVFPLNTYYFSCESFSWNYKPCITSERLASKFPNPESQTSLGRLIYLPAFSWVFSYGHMLSTVFV